MNAKMNPEFQRQVWLEITLHRLVVMPLVLGGIGYLSVLLSTKAPGETLSWIAQALFGLLAFGWGTYLAADSVTGDVKARTWDWQRMSSLTPWAMTWGKLAGSTLYPWYGGAICLGVYGLARPAPDWGWLLMLVLGAVFSQAVALLASLVALARRQTADRSATLSCLVVAGLMVSPFLGLYSAERVVTWYGYPLPAPTMALGSMALWTFWALIGCCRQMSSELQVPAAPTAWVGFLLCLWLYVAGFFPTEGAPAASVLLGRVAFGFFLMLLMSYVAILGDRKDPVALARMLRSWRARQWRRLLETVPRWLPALLLTAVFGMAFALLPHVLPGATPTAEVGRAVQFLADGTGILWIAAILLFLLRDVGLVLYFNLGPRRTRVDGTALVYLAVLYLLLPGILGALKLDLAVAMLMPWLLDHPLISFLAGLAQAALMATLLQRRWQQSFSALHRERAVTVTQP